MEFFFDTETTGLPERSGKYGYPVYTASDKYAKARIVSISWMITRRQQLVSQAYYVIKPEGFVIGEDSTAIHGISQEDALRSGVSFKVVAGALKEALKGCMSLVAHNIDFDYHVLLSELHRGGFPDVINVVKKLNLVCTMKKGREMLKMRAYPKLAVLYKALYGEDMENAHNAQYDTFYCYKCYVKMFPLDASLFFFGDKAIRLTDAQKDIVFEDMNKHMLVIACAGAGKTLTVICRVKYLIECGVSEESIMLTTFTRDAASDMKGKLLDIMGYTPEVTVGTIDSIARKYSMGVGGTGIKDVSEYGYYFLEALRRDPKIVAQYKYLFVDEFQDINDVQFEIIKIFYENGCKIFGVGDDSQNIYSFRGSKIEFILSFDKTFEGASVKFLKENFRSTRNIIALANACIENNSNSIPKTMVAASGEDGAKPRVRYFQNASMQNTIIYEQITELLKEGVAEHEIVVLSPINQPLYLIEEILTKNGIKNVYLDGKTDVKTAKKPWHVCLCTVHKAKGLEWDHVFGICVSDEVIPKTKTAGYIEEARRLFYVLVTRARKMLALYYTTVNESTPYVTRYISELGRDLYDCECMDPKHFGVSDYDCVVQDLSVSRLIEFLDGGDYIKLKELGIIPAISVRDIKKTRLYDGYGYSRVIEREDLYSDFGIFVEKYIKGCLSRAVGMKSIDKHAMMCLANVKLEPNLMMVYNMYKANFRLNVRNLRRYWGNLVDNKFTVKAILENNAKKISETHIGNVLTILREIKKKADMYKLEPAKVPVFSKRFLPIGFEAEIKRQHAEYVSGGDVGVTWDVAKCKKIVCEYRRRLLYKGIGISDLSDYEGLFAQIRETLVDFVRGLGSEMGMEEEWEIKEGIYGETDLRVGDLIVDYKSSVNDEISLAWIVQLLCYKTLCDLNGRTIKRVGILNALRGWYGEIDVSGWNKHEELVKFLLERARV